MTDRSIDKLMSSVAADLWGAKPPQEPAPAVEAAPAYQPAFPPFDQLWTTADETVDWTEALISPEPTDGLTSPRLWSFFHRHARGVLDGDLHAYAEVLRTANPLGDLTRYTKGVAIDVRSADKLTARFDVAETYLQGDSRRYLCGMALRMARDLMAILPVTEVQVIARQGETILLDATFPRQQMQKVRFTFVDPVAFVEEMNQ